MGLQKTDQQGDLAHITKAFNTSCKSLRTLVGYISDDAQKDINYKQIENRISAAKNIFDTVTKEIELDPSKKKEQTAVAKDTLNIFDGYRLALTSKLVKQLFSNNKNLTLEDLHVLSAKDTLTDMPNTAVFNQQIQTAVSKNAHPAPKERRDKGEDKGQPTEGGTNHYFALVYIDFDRFKGLNDTFGHDCGDKALIAVADKLRTTARDENNTMGSYGSLSRRLRDNDDTTSRKGGDEFTLIFHARAKNLDAAKLEFEKAHARTKNALAVTPLKHEHNGITITLPIVVSMGMHILEEGDTVNSACNKADEALFESKRTTKIARYEYALKQLEKRGYENVTEVRDIRNETKLTPIQVRTMINLGNKNPIDITDTQGLLKAVDELNAKESLGIVIVDEYDEPIQTEDYTP